MAETLMLQCRREAGVAVIGLQGRLDGNTSEQLAAFFAQHVAPEDRAVVLDAGQLAYVSSAGLREFLKLAKQLHRHKARPALAAMTPMVAETLEVAGFQALFHCVPTVDAGVRAVTGEAPARAGLLGRLFGGPSAG